MLRLIVALGLVLVLGGDLSAVGEAPAVKQDNDVKCSTADVIQLPGADFFTQEVNGECRVTHSAGVMRNGAGHVGEPEDFAGTVSPPGVFNAPSGTTFAPDFAGGTASGGSIIVRSTTHATKGPVILDGEPITASNASGGDTTVASTSHATKGQYFFGTAETTYFDETNSNWIWAGKATTYNGMATVGPGLPGIVAEVNLTAQGANITNQNIYTPSAAGLYRLSGTIGVTRVATTSSTMPSFQLAYTHGDSAQLQLPVLQTSNTGNLLTTVFSLSHTFYAANSAINFSTASYASSGATSMQYNLRLRLEAL